MSATEAEAGAAALAQTRLVLDSVRLRRGGVTVLDTVSVELPWRGITVILGPNGAGKTTLLQVIQGLVEPDGGSVGAIGPGREPVGFRPAFVFQKPVMLRRSVLGNLTHALSAAGVPRRERAARAASALAGVGLADHVRRPARALSGGEQQRLAIARANALTPDGLLLDEPCASLDPGSTAAVERLLLGISAGGRGILMSTHDLAQARRLAGRVVFLHRGRVLEVAAAADFFRAPGSSVARRFVAGLWIDD